MLRNFFVVTLRNLWRNKSFSAINILGLAIGMASALLIGLWVQNEVSYDRFYDKTARIYRLYSREIVNGKTDAWPRVSTQMAADLKKNYAEVEDAVKLRHVYFLMTEKEKRLNIQGAFVDSGFLSVFSLPLLKGDAKTALSGGHGIVLTEHVAKNLFGNEDPMGKMVRVDTMENVVVTGVLKDLPGTYQNSAFNTCCPGPFSTGWVGTG